MLKRMSGAVGEKTALEIMPVASLFGSADLKEIKRILHDYIVKLNFLLVEQMFGEVMIEENV